MIPSASSRLSTSSTRKLLVALSLILALSLTGVGMYSADAHVEWRWYSFKESTADDTCRKRSDPVTMIWLGVYAHVGSVKYDLAGLNGREGHLNQTYGGNWGHTDPDVPGHEQYFEDSADCATNNTELANHGSTTGSKDRFHVRLGAVYNHPSRRDMRWTIGTPHFERDEGAFGHCIPGFGSSKGSGFDHGRRKFTRAYRHFENRPGHPRHSVRVNSLGHSRTAWTRDGCKDKKTGTDGQVSWIKHGKIKGGDRLGPFE